MRLPKEFEWEQKKLAGIIPSRPFGMTQPSLAEAREMDEQDDEGDEDTYSVWAFASKDDLLAAYEIVTDADLGIDFELFGNEETDEWSLAVSGELSDEDIEVIEDAIAQAGFETR